MLGDYNNTYTHHVLYKTQEYNNAALAPICRLRITLQFRTLSADEFEQADPSLLPPCWQLQIWISFFFHAPPYDLVYIIGRPMYMYMQLIQFMYMCVLKIKRQQSR